MAYFKLSLLTPRFENNSTIFIEDTITEFFPQKDEYLSKNKGFLRNTSDVSGDIFKQSLRKNTITNTYNEKLSKSQNAQKTLSFDLDRYLIKMDEWYENPFSNNIIIGSQILLTDQYLNEYIFTVTSIKYTIKENNITYNISCQDSFSYQMARQQDGYTIENDIESEDFIGAKTVDWWVKQKIVPECYLSSYKYIGCDEGLYETINEEYRTFKYFETLRDVKRIIKDAHVPPVYKNGKVEEGKENDLDYFETIPFSCSSSNADAALIALGEEINMQLATFEHAKIIDGQRTKYFDKFFWFEPKKNDKRIGLKYSPTRNIKSFDLTHQGQSLTTVLNVDGPTYNDELITLLPAVPSFFHQYFHTQEWKDSKYAPGLFSNLCQRQVFSSTNDEVVTIENRYFNIGDITFNSRDNKVWEIKIPIYNETIGGELLFKRKSLFDYFNFSGDPDAEHPQTSGLLITYTKENNEQNVRDTVTYFTTPYTDIWELCYDKKVGNITETKVYRQDTDLIESRDIEKQFYIKITTMLNEPSFDNTIQIDEVNPFSEEKFYINFYRDVTEEDLEFAKIADECPWLENKLIDFSYFKENNIISLDEYSNLLDTLQNELRIVNGQLMFYAQQYYEALRERTEILARLTTDLDSLGATCQAAIIDPIAETGATKDISYFDNAYKNIWTKSKEPTSILAYDDLLNEYFYKYYNAEQRFLKNIYYFKKYFNDINLLNDKDLYKYTLTIDNPKDLNSPFYSFKKGNFTSIKPKLSENNPGYIYYSGYNKNEKDEDTSLNDYGRPLLPIFSSNSAGLIPMPVASKDLWEQQLYLAPDLFGKDFYCDPEQRRATYNNKIEYIKPIILIQVTKVGDNKNIRYKIEDISSENPYNYAFVNDITKINATTEREYITNNRYRSYKYNSTSMPEPKSWIGTYKIVFNRTETETKELYCKAIGIETEKIDQNNINYYLKLQPIVYTEDLVSLLGGFDGTNLQNKILINKNITINAVYAKWTQEGKLRKSDLPHEYEEPIWTVVSNGANNYLKGERISLTDIINNYLLTASIEDIKKFFTTYSPLYRKVNVEDDSYEENNESDDNGRRYSLKKIKNLLLKYINPFYIVSAYEDDDEEKDTYFLKKSEEKQKKMARIQYLSYLPITELYQKAPIFSITKANSIQDNKNELYNIERLNQKKQSFSDYIKYREAINEDKFAVEVINPFDNSQMTYQSVPFVTPNNQADFLRRVRISGVELGFMIGVSGLSALTSWVFPIRTIKFLAATLTNPIEKPGVRSDTDIFDNSIPRPFSTYLTWDMGDEEGKEKPEDRITEPCYVSTKEGYDLFEKYNNSFSEYRRWTQRDYPNGINKTAFLKPDNIYRYAPFGTLSYNPDTKLISYRMNEAENLKYFKYNTFGYTTQSMQNDMYYIDTYYRPLTLNSILTHGNVYGILKVCIGEYDTSWESETDYRKTILKLNKTPNWNDLETNIFSKDLSAIDWYPITKQIEGLDISAAENKDTLRNLLKASNMTPIEEESTNHIIKVKIDNTVCYIVVYQYIQKGENYLIDSLQYNDALKNYGATKYMADNTDYFDFTNIDGLTQGFYMLPTISKDRVPAKDKESEFSMTSEYYNADGNRIYTIKQLKESNKIYYYFTTTPLEIFDFTDQCRDFNIEIYKNTPIWENNCLKTVEQDLLTQITKVKFPKEPTAGTNENIYSTTIKVRNEEITINLKATLEEKIVGLTNGTFWNKYKNRLDLPLLNEQAASIQAQLTLYWEQAFTASKYCEYFLPEQWTETLNQSSNTFFNKIVILTNDNQTILSDTFLPNVKIYKDSKKNTILPKYKFTKISSLSYTSDKINQMNFISAADLIDNEAIKTVFAQLNEDPNDWYAEKIGETTYYYSNNGGKTWPQFLNIVLSKGSSYQEMSGLYLMTYKILKNNYLPLDCSQYNSLMDQHNAIWNKINENYGFVILENSYKNTTATTSSDLLKVAKLYFKDKMNPERGYNIAIIDTASLENYDGVEIRIGDGIQVDAKQYYNKYDQLYNSLSQYLFITDLNYTLRDSSNINLTVNSIKYEEGIIKRIAKLIK